MASYGIGMGAIIALLVVVCAVQGLRLWVRKRYMSPVERRFVDLVLGFYAMYFGGSVFEGYVISRVSTQLVMMLIFSAIGARLLQMTSASARAGDWGGEEAPEYADWEAPADQPATA
jgi:hypothetical protein